jgi:hypothetical protein
VWCSVPPVSGGNKPFKYSVKIITRLTRRIASHVGNPVAVSEAKNLLFKLWGHPNFEGWYNKYILHPYVDPVNSSISRYTSSSIQVPLSSDPLEFKDRLEASD